MNTKDNDKRLEAFKIFPYVAWGLTLVFAIFVYKITTELQEVTRELQVQTQQLQKQINTPVHEIKDFESS